MTASELIEALRSVPGDTEVVIEVDVATEYRHIAVALSPTVAATAGHIPTRAQAAMCLTMGDPV